MGTKNQMKITASFLALFGCFLVPLKASARADTPAASSPPPAVRSSVMGGSATIAPVRLVSMIDEGTRFTLLQNVILPPGRDSVEIARFESFTVSLINLSVSNSSQLIESGTTFVSSRVPRCWAHYHDASQQRAHCSFDLAGARAQILLTTFSPYNRNLDHHFVGSLPARQFSEGVANVLQIDVPAPVAYGSASR